MSYEGRDLAFEQEKGHLIMDICCLLAKSYGFIPESRKQIRDNPDLKKSFLDILEAHKKHNCHLDKVVDSIKSDLESEEDDKPQGIFRVMED